MRSKLLVVGVTGSPDRVVDSVASRLAALTDSSVEPLLLGERGTQQANADSVLAGLSRADVRFGLLRASPERRAACWRIMSESAKPLVLLPPGASQRDRAIMRVLMPLDGTSESTAAMAETLALLSAAATDIVVLHVFDRDRVPKYWDQAAHASEAWSQAFLTRHAPSNASLRLRNGPPGEHILAVADEEDVDLIALGWSQRLDPGRAHTVRRTVLDASVPVLLAAVGHKAESDSG